MTLRRTLYYKSNEDKLKKYNEELAKDLRNQLIQKEKLRAVKMGDQFNEDMANELADIYSKFVSKTSHPTNSTSIALERGNSKLVQQKQSTPNQPVVNQVALERGKPEPSKKTPLKFLDEIKSTFKTKKEIKDLDIQLDNALDKELKKTNIGNSILDDIKSKIKNPQLRSAKDRVLREKPTNSDIKTITLKDELLEAVENINTKKMYKNNTETIKGVLNDIVNKIENSIDVGTPLNSPTSTATTFMMDQNENEIKDLPIGTLRKNLKALYKNNPTFKRNIGNLNKATKKQINAEFSRIQMESKTSLL